jgi:spectinomycin phosphotransferase
MREPPSNLTDEMILAYLRDQYGLAVTNLAFLPLGHDSSAWVYRIQTDDGAPYFLKVRTSIANQPSLLVPRYLQDLGVANVVAPLPTLTHALWATTEDYALILYPFIAGVTGMEQGMLPQQWIDYGKTLRQIHDTPVAPELTQHMRRETFTPGGADMVRKLDAYIGEQHHDGPAAQTIATFWQARRTEIHTLLNRAEELGRRLAQAPPPFLLCHADIHTNNVLLDTEQKVWIVDWDETVLAPKERDLMFVVGGISAELVGPREEALFFEGYGQTTIDPLALAYYRYAWALGDIGDFGAQVFFRPDLGAVTKHEAVRYFTGLFQPGEIVAIAFASVYPAA